VSNRRINAALTDGGETCLDGVATGMARSVLAEIGQRLNELSETGRSTVISLRGLPMTRTDRAQLEESLGRGEVFASLELAGASEVWETRYPGVWWIRHRGAGGQIVCEEIAVTPIPDILKTHPEDIRMAAVRLSDELARQEHLPDMQTRNPQYDTEAPDVR